MKNFPLSHANIIEILGVGALPAEKRVAIVDSVIDLVETRVQEKVLASLSENARAHLIELLEKEDEDALENFLDEHDINVFALTEKEVEEAKKELVGFIEKVDEMI